MATDSLRRLQIFAPGRARSGEAARPDYLLIMVVGTLLIIGVLIIYSVSFGPNVQSGDNPLSLVERHGAFLILGLAVMFILMRSDYHFLQRIAVPLLAICLISLVLVLFFGEENQGARRWFLSGSVQPGEFAKLISVVYIAAWVTSKGAKLRRLTYGLIPFSFLVGVVTGLIALEPNYSTAILIGLTAFAMFFVAGADLIQFTLSVLIGGVTAAFLISRSPRALERILLMMSDPFKLPVDQAWQLTQSLIALASGGVFGKGLGWGGGQYGYVPLAHSDGIFAIWGEETGIVGTWLLVGLVLFLAYRGFRIASKAPDDFGRVLASGVTVWLTLQAFVNIGVVTQLIPFTGQPLPFISYGGSALVTALAGIGMLLSVSRGKAPPVVVKSAARAPAAPASAEKEKHASIDYGWGNGRPRVSPDSGGRKPRRRTRARPES